MLSFKQALSSKSIGGWGLRLKLGEVIVALLVVFGTIYVGIKANDILSRQNSIVESQMSASQRVGRQQNQAALLQAYITSSQSAGYTTEQERRMLHLSLDLYGLLVQEDPKFRMLYTSMPAMTETQLAELIESRPADRDEIQQIFARRNDASQALEPEGPYHLIQNGAYQIVIGTFRNPDYATGALRQAREFLRPSAFHPYMNIALNEDNLYLATLSGFATREEVQSALTRERLQTQFPSAYASQTRGWRLVCSARFDICSRAAPRGTPPARP